ncbi:hypothetical protein EOE18_05850 [Novosphingobium umbonatum]|uniref:ATP-dependent RNA helicase n=1 Tax=Novosphingobium umbonatum TaxID=1908524 RepID=A0A3S2VUT1_9SPHN|nr:RcnB family protein [Novosphingobium umbonatum]RVU06346.1 hypothetical protein EOE18_05850 [Novosphingobium umbonatum]
MVKNFKSIRAVIGLASLAVLAQGLVVPAMAAPEDRGGEYRGPRGGGERPSGGQGGTFENRGGGQMPSPSRYFGSSSAASRPSPPSAAPAPRGNDGFRPAPSMAAPSAPAPVQGWQMGNRGNDAPRQNAQPNAAPRHEGWRNDAPRNDGSRNDGWRGEERRADDRGRNESWRGTPGWGGTPNWNGNRGWNDRREPVRVAPRQNYNRWTHDWRRDNRYNWQAYRSSNRMAFHVGRYYPPYNGYAYRRLSVGFLLQPLFYSQSYRIYDPWTYHLPAAYEPYHWVRYYDDALLVDGYTGEVVDILYDFFW